MRTPALEFVYRLITIDEPWSEGGTGVQKSGCSKGDRLAGAEVDERKSKAHLRVQVAVATVDSVPIP